MFKPYELRVCHDTGDGSVHLEVHGEVDTMVAPQLLDSVLCAAMSYDHHNIVVDLSGCTFMDSSGLAALIAAHCRLVDDRSHLVITNAPPMVARIMELAGLDSVLDIRPRWMSASL
ncbi:MAG: STAS domain-containing protein [Acidimicrobiales bacterium]